jgi:hypothetical protein
VHTDIAPEPTCNRHPNRPGDPWCFDCRTDIHKALVDLPRLYTALLDTDGRDTPTKLIGGRSSIDPGSPSPRFDHAEFVAWNLAYWAGAWAEFLGEDWTADRDPRRSATYLNRHRAADLLSAPFADEMGADITRIHARALKLLGGDENSTEPVTTNLNTPCPKCDSTATRREVDITRSGVRSDRVTCRHCDLNLPWDMFVAIQEHRQQAAGQITPRHLAQRHLADSHTAA